MDKLDGPARLMVVSDLDHTMVSFNIKLNLISLFHSMCN
jgi:hypothetical protein